MIFVTIGSLFPFDRLVRLIDEMAPKFPDEEFFCQIGNGKYEPVNCPFSRMLPAPEFSAKLKASSLIVAHAGMGSVIMAMENNKPIVILPRILEQGEHTTDHQMATARWLRSKSGIRVAMTDEELEPCMRTALSASGEDSQISNKAPDEFLQKIRSYILAAAGT